MNFEIYCSGMFNRRVVIEQLVPATDDWGQAHYGPAAPQGQWVTVIECWAKISPTWGQELRQANVEMSETWAAIDIRYGSGVNILPSMRVRDKRTGELWDIRTVMHIDSARKVVEMTCLKIQ